MYQSELIRLLLHSSLIFSSFASPLIAENRLTAGQYTSIQRYPFNIVIQELSQIMWFDQWESICGGAIVHKKFAVTTFGCADGEKLRIIAGAGEIGRFSQNDYYIHNVKQKFFHVYNTEVGPNSFTQNTANVVLLEVERHFEFNNDTLMPIELLNDTNTDTPFSKIYKFGEIVGFGQESDNFWNLRTLVPKRIDVKFTFLARCKINDFRENICIQGVNGNPCIHDYGDPVLVNINGVHYLAGLVDIIRKDCGDYSTAVRIGHFFLFIYAYSSDD